MVNNKLKLLMCADDPDTILSYGLLSKMLIDRLHKDYEIHYESLQRQVGFPINREGKYIKYASRLQGERTPTNLPNIINEVRPDIVWTNFDIQIYEKFIANNLIPKSVSWCGWLPWDNHDAGQAARAKKVFQHVDVKIAISLFGYDFLRSHGLRMDGYIYNIIDTKSYFPLSKKNKGLKKFKREKGYNEDFKYLLFVGRPNWRKRMTHMMAIMKELKIRGRNDIKLILHSNIYDGGSNTNLPEIIDSGGLFDNIILNRFPYDVGIAKKELNYMYNIADLYIAPHGGEGFGMPIGESMATGTPFIASDICTTPEFAGQDNERGFPAPVYYPRDAQGRPIPDMTCGCIRPYPKVKEFADLIESALGDENRLKVMGKKGMEWVKKYCSPEVVAGQWKNIFNSFDIKYGKVNGYR